MTRHLLLSAALAAGFTAMSPFAAFAQDPASVGGRGDPALVGGGGGYRSSAPAYYGGGSPAGGYEGAFGGQTPAAYADESQTRERSVREVEVLLQMVRSQLDGTGDTRSNTGRYRGADVDAARYRSDAEVLIRRNWKQLGPLTRDLYTSNYDRTDPNDPNQRYRQSFGNGGDPESRMLGGAQDAAGAMQNLEDMLLPMLQDLKRGVDTELRQRSR